MLETVPDAVAWASAAGAALLAARFRHRVLTRLDSIEKKVDALSNK
jgi:hypothetical protein